MMVAGLITALAVLPGCMVRYVVKSARFEAALLAGRRPISKVLLSGSLPPDSTAKLALIPQIKLWGERNGLSRSHNYETINVRWQRTVYNFSACEPLSFTPRTWGFPIVGRVPYLGFFQEAEVQRYVRRYTRRGDDTWVRPVGAWSTLGWFRDPVLPAMLEWEEADLAEVLLHELAHASLWVRGNVDFNETFASVTGEVASDRWMVERYGVESAAVARMRQARNDDRIFHGIVHSLFKELDSTYRSAEGNDDDRLRAKNELFADLPDRVVQSGIIDQERYQDLARSDSWNNARLWQYRTYDADPGAFLTILDQENGDIASFILRLQKIIRRPGDPWMNLSSAARIEKTGNVKDF